jgi:arabinofuranan 3-O-arabinosyltransferase
VRYVGGPLYPPVHGFVFFPLALMRPHVAYRINQILNLVEALLAGWAMRRLSGNRFWLPLTALMVIGFFGFSSSMTLGQNATLTLTILLWGWVFMAEAKPWRGGLIWGLLAFKPVWALSFFLFPLLTQRWRACLAMGLTGLTLFALTLPVVGWHSWLDWLAVGHEAAETYKTDGNWIPFSRDVLGLPRRWFAHPVWEWKAPAEEKGESAVVRLLRQVARRLPNAGPDDPRWLADLVGWAMLGGIILATAGLALFRRREAQARSGPIPAFILLGAWLCSYHFMYYDTLLAILPLTVLLVDPDFYLVPKLVWFNLNGRLTRAVTPARETVVGTDLAGYYRPCLAQAYPRVPAGLPFSLRHLWTLNSLALTLIVLIYLEHPFNIVLLLITGHQLYGVPWDTYCLIVLWLWCGIRWLRGTTNICHGP